MNASDRSLVRAIRGPVTLITVGVLFALNNFTAYGFERTWPVLLIVFGLLSLLRRGTDPPRTSPGPAFSPYTYPPPPGGYPQSPYSTPPAGGPYQGGFGTGGRPGDSGATPPSGGSQ
jgi:hypothetical protein